MRIGAHDVWYIKGIPEFRLPMVIPEAPGSDSDRWTAINPIEAGFAAPSETVSD
jgi:hypothetical protein